MKTQFLFLTILFSITALSSCSKPTEKETSSWEKYEVLATKIVGDADTASFTQLAKSSEELTQLSVKLLPDFVSKQPICTEYIQAVMNAQTAMLNLSLEDIERDYHADGKLPEIKDAACYHAKDLLVHPATAAIISKTLDDTTENRQQLKHEIEEVLEHFNQVKISADL